MFEENERERKREEWGERGRKKARRGGERGRKSQRKRERDENGGKGVAHSVPFTTIKTKRDENEHQESDLKPKL